MYIVRDKSTQEIIHTNPAPLSQALTEKEVYFHFDPATMEIGKTEGALPKHYTINKYGDIEPLPDTEGEETVPIWEQTMDKQVAAGYRKLSELEKLAEVDGEMSIVPKTVEEQLAEGLIKLDEPFQQLENGEVVSKSLDEVLDEGLLKTTDGCIKASDTANQLMESAIAREFSPGREMKVTKNYLAWLKEGQPAEDPRETDYENMQAVIESIKEEFRPIKAQIKAIQEQLEKQVKAKR